MTAKGAVAALASVACLLALNACGGEDTTTTVIQEVSEPGEPNGATIRVGEPSEDQANYIREADAICAAVNRDLERFPSDTPAYYRVLEQGTEDLDAMPVPDSLETPVSQYLGAVYDMIDAQQRGDDRQAKEADRRKESAAQAIGFLECGTG